MGALAKNRVLSGMRPTGRLHLGHFHGVLKNWVRLQEAGEYECLFCVADWHALTTHYEEAGGIAGNAVEMVIDWLASGVNPERAILFVQSRVPQHAELHLLLSMVTPISWLERVPSFKEQQEKLGAQGRDLATYGFLGYPLLQAADILVYRATHVPVGEDQAPHVELTREVARRFNECFGRGEGFESKVAGALEALGEEGAKRYKGYRRAFTEQGKDFKKVEAKNWLAGLIGRDELGAEQRDYLLANLEGRGEAILPEPKVLLTEAAKMTGLDGQKMSKSYENMVALRDEPKRVEEAIARMPTDPARVRLSDAGEPEKCPVWGLHRVYSDGETRAWVEKGCRGAEFGCLECKKPLVREVLREQEGFRERALPYEKDRDGVRDMLEAGNRRAGVLAEETMERVRAAIGVDYSIKGY